MKLTGGQAATYEDAPDPTKAGVLIYGTDGMRVALKRQAMIKALVGPEGEAEMRLTRIAGTDVRKDAAAVLDALKAVGFFPGPRAVLIDGANETAADGIVAALQDWTNGDAQLVVTAGMLKKTSKIRKAFENHNNAYAWAIYDNPPTRGELEAMIKKAALGNVDRDAMAALEALSKDLDPGDFSQTLEKLALYTLDQDGPVMVADIEACAPVSVEAGIDDVLNVVADARTGELAMVMNRLTAQGITPTTLCIGAMRHFRTLHRAASHPGGPSQGVAALRPPLYGARRDQVQRQVQRWGRMKLERALGLILETDRALRSAGQTAPQMAVVERCLIRLSMMAPR